MSTQLDNSISSLKSKQTGLLENLYNFKSLGDEDIKISLITQVFDFQQELEFAKEDIEFNYGINIESNLKINDPNCLEIIANWNKYNDFLLSFKESLTQNYSKLKENQSIELEQLKQDKYKIASTDSASDAQNEEKFIKDKNISTDSKILSTTKRITSRLAQSSQILQASLVQSELNFEELNTQSDSLSDLADKYGYLKDVLERSDVFINDIKLSTQKDKNMMYYALIFFGLCLFKVFWGRIFKLPVVFVFKIFWYTIHTLLAGIGLVSRNSSLSTANNEFSTLTSELATSSVTTTSTLEGIYTSSLDNSEPNIYASSEIKEENEDDGDLKEGEDIDSALNRIIDEL